MHDFGRFVGQELAQEVDHEGGNKENSDGEATDRRVRRENVNSEWRSDADTTFLHRTFRFN